MIRAVLSIDPGLLLIVTVVLGPVYTILYCFVSRLPAWGLAPLLALCAAPYYLNWDYLMGSGPYDGIWPYIFLITVIGALTAALVYRVAGIAFAGRKDERREPMRLLIGLAGFPISAFSVLA